MTTTQQLRSLITDQARWGIAHTTAIHYAEVRPIPLETYKRHQLPVTTDCSGWVTCCYYAAGAPDPNGLGYNGAGFTGTLLDHLRPITLAKAQPGDLVVFGSHPGLHVVMVLEATGSNPLVGSHGSEAGPIAIAFEAEHRGFPGVPFTVLEGLPTDTPRQRRRRRWVVHNGRGEILAHGRTKRAADRRVTAYAFRNRKRWQETTTVVYHRRHHHAQD